MLEQFEQFEEVSARRTGEQEQELLQTLNYWREVIHSKYARVLVGFRSKKDELNKKKTQQVQVQVQAVALSVKDSLKKTLKETFFDLSRWFLPPLSGLAQPKAVQLQQDKEEGGGKQEQKQKETETETEAFQRLERIQNGEEMRTLFRSLSVSSYLVWTNLFAAAETTLYSSGSAEVLYETKLTIESAGELFWALLNTYDCLCALFSAQVLSDLFRSKKDHLTHLLSAVHELNVKLRWQEFHLWLGNATQCRKFRDLVSVSLSASPLLTWMFALFFFLSLDTLFSLPFSSLNTFEADKRSLEIKKLESEQVRKQLMHFLFPLISHSKAGKHWEQESALWLESLVSLSAAIPECSICLGTLNTQPEELGVQLGKTTKSTTRKGKGEEKTKSEEREKQEEEEEEGVWSASADFWNEWPWKVLYSASREDRTKVRTCWSPDCGKRKGREEEKKGGGGGGGGIKEGERHLFHASCLASAFEAQADQQKCPRQSHQPLCPACWSPSSSWELVILETR